MTVFGMAEEKVINCSVCGVYLPDVDKPQICHDCTKLLARRNVYSLDQLARVALRLPEAFRLGYRLNARGGYRGGYRIHWKQLGWVISSSHSYRPVKMTPERAKVGAIMLVEGLERSNTSARFAITVKRHKIRMRSRVLAAITRLQPTAVSRKKRKK